MAPEVASAVSSASANLIRLPSFDGAMEPSDGLVSGGASRAGCAGVECTICAVWRGREAVAGTWLRRVAACRGVSGLTRRGAPAARRGELGRRQGGRYGHLT